MAGGIDETLRALAAHEPLSRAGAKALSGLASREIVRFENIWLTLPDPERLNVLATLRQHATESSLLDFDAIYLMAMNDQNADVRRVAALATIDDENLEILPKLLGLAAHDPDEMVRTAAAERLAGFAYEAEVGKLPEEDRQRIQETLLDLVKSETEAPHVRAAALASVGYLSTPAVRTQVRDALREAALRLAAIRAVARNLDPVWADSLVEHMADEDPAVRREAAIAASEYEGTVEALGDLVDDPDMSVRLAAIASLGKIGGSEAYELLVYCHESSDPSVREAAAKAMEDSGEDDDLSDLRPFEPEAG